MSDRVRPPVMFFERRGSFAASWTCRFRRVLCALGRHGWMLGPFDGKGCWVDAEGRHWPSPEGLYPYVCSFGSPWCRARRVLFAAEFRREYDRREHPGFWRRLECRLAGWSW